MSDCNRLLMPRHYRDINGSGVLTLRVAAPTGLAKFFQSESFEPKMAENNAELALNCRSNARLFVSRRRVEYGHAGCNVYASGFIG